MGCLLRNGFTTLAPSSSCETPTTSTPFDAHSSLKRLKLGISRMQGTHQVAQKLRTSTRSDTTVGSKAAPSRVFSPKSVRTLGDADAEVAAAADGADAGAG